MHVQVQQLDSEREQLEREKEQRVAQLRKSAETVEIIKGAIGDSAAETLIASHSHVRCVPLHALPSPCCVFPTPLSVLSHYLRLVLLGVCQFALPPAKLQSPWMEK